MTKESAAKEISRLLEVGDYKLVLVESCTTGFLASILGEIPGISDRLCGSLVVYRSDSKKKWLGIKNKAIRTFTTESQPIADRLAKSALRKTPEADYSLAIVGHLGPNSPEDKDGKIWISIARRTNKNKIKVKDQLEYICSASHDTTNGIALRINRRSEAADAAFTALARVLNKKVCQRSNGKRTTKEKLKHCKKSKVAD